MIWIDKGPAPDILLNDGATFQNDAMAFEANFATVGVKLVKPKGKRRKKKDDDDDNGKANPLVSHAKLTDAGGFGGYESKLFSLFSYYSHPDVKSRLILSHHGKCAFCESFIMATDVGDVEHYRPKAEVSEVDPHNTAVERTVTDHTGYYWLSQTWENLFLSCKQCNQAFKGNRFDVIPQQQGFNLVLLRDRAGAGQAEAPLLLYPGQGGGTDPRVALRFDAGTAEVAPAQQGVQPNDMSKALATIHTVGLNRPRLLEDRAAHLVKLRALFVLAASAGGQQAPGEAADILSFHYEQNGPWAHAQTGLAEAVQAHAEYSALAQDAITQWNQELQMAPATVNVAFQQAQQQVQINTNLALALQPWLDLYNTLRDAAAQQVGSQADPDTTDLDVSYNDILARYKVVCSDIDDDRDDLQESLQDSHARREDLHLQQQTWTEEMRTVHNSEDPLFDTEEEITRTRQGIEENQTFIAVIERGEQLANGDQNGAYAGVESFLHRQQILYQATSRSPQERHFDKQQARLAVKNGNDQLNGLNQRLAQLQHIADSHEQEQQELVEAIEEAEELMDEYFTRLFDLLADAVENAQGYRNCGAPRDRSKRADDLSEAISDMYDFISEFDENVGSVKLNLQSKGFPPMIRKKKG